MPPCGTTCARPCSPCSAWPGALPRWFFCLLMAKALPAPSKPFLKDGRPAWMALRFRGGRELHRLDVRVPKYPCVGFRFWSKKRNLLTVGRPFEVFYGTFAFGQRQRLAAISGHHIDLLKFLTVR